MPVIYNSPPGWPEPPAGWLPPDDWRPDPAWGAPPEGWNWYTVIPDPAPPSPFSPLTHPDSPEAATDYATARSDITVAIRRMGRTLGIKRELGNLESRLDAGETVMELARVERKGHGCLLAVTNRRLMFIREGMVRNTIEEFPIRAVTSVGSRRRLTNGHLLVTVAGNAEVWPMTSASHSERVSESIRQLMRQHDAPAPIATPAPPPSPVHQPLGAQPLIDQLGKLGELRAAGLLTDEEFAAAKAKLLS